MFVNTREITVEWGHCDPAGIVFYPRYFEMFDASTAFMFAAALGMSKRDMLSRFDAVGFPMVDTRAKFQVPSAFGDVIRIESRITKIGRSAFDVSHRILKGEVLAAEGFETRVWVGRDPADSSKIRSRPLPEEVVSALSQGR